MLLTRQYGTCIYCIYLLSSRVNSREGEGEARGRGHHHPPHPPEEEEEEEEEEDEACSMMHQRSTKPWKVGIRARLQTWLTCSTTHQRSTRPWEVGIRARLQTWIACSTAHHRSTRISASGVLPFPILMQMTSFSTLAAHTKPHHCLLMVEKLVRQDNLYNPFVIDNERTRSSPRIETDRHSL